MCCWFLLATSALASVQPSWREKALKLIQEGQDEESRRILLEVVRRDPRNQDAHALLGQIAFDRKDYREAAIRFAKAPLVLKANPLLLVNYAESLFETNAPGAAGQMLETVPRRNAAAQFESGLLLTRFGDHPSAEEHFRLARSAGYSDVAGLTYNLALVQYRLAKFRECSLTLEEVRERFPAADLLNLLALAYIELGEFQKALQTLNTALSNYPLDERNYVAAARLAIEANAPALGLELLDRGLGYLPKSYPLLVQRGYLRLVQGRYQDAESDYRTAIELKPNLDAARLGLAFVFTASQRHGEAVASLRETIRLRPSNAQAHYLLAELLLIGGAKPGDPAEEEALAHLKQAANLDPGLASVHTTLGTLYLKRNDVTAAIRELERATQLDPEATTAYYQLSIAYRKVGERQKAQKFLDRVRLLNEEERKLGTNRFLYQKLKRAPAGVLTLSN